MELFYTRTSSGLSIEERTVKNKTPVQWRLVLHRTDVYIVCIMTINPNLDIVLLSIFSPYHSVNHTRIGLDNLHNLG